MSNKKKIVPELMRVMHSEPLDVEGVVNNIPSANRSLSRRRLVENLECFGETFPFDMCLEADYNIIFGPCQVLSDIDSTNLLCGKLYQSFQDDSEVVDIARDAVNSGNIIFARTPMVKEIKEILDDIPCDVLVPLKTMVMNISAEQMFFIQYLTPRATGWNLTSFGGAGGMMFAADVFVLVKDSQHPSIRRFNEAVGMVGYTFGKDMSKKVFGKIVEKSLG